MQITVSTTISDNTYCRWFYDVELSYGGIEVYEFEGGEKIGVMVGVEMPDENDDEEMAKFSSELEDWLVDQEI